MWKKKNVLFFGVAVTIFLMISSVTAVNIKTSDLEITDYEKKTALNVSQEGNKSEIKECELCEKSEKITKHMSNFTFYNPIIFILCGFFCAFFVYRPCIKSGLHSEAYCSAMASDCMKACVG